MREGEDNPFKGTAPVVLHRKRTPNACRVFLKVMGTAAAAGALGGLTSAAAAYGSLQLLSLTAGCNPFPVDAPRACVFPDFSLTLDVEDPSTRGGDRTIHMSPQTYLTERSADITLADFFLQSSLGGLIGSSAIVLMVFSCCLGSRDALHNEASTGKKLRELLFEIAVWAFLGSLLLGVDAGQLLTGNTNLFSSDDLQAAHASDGDGYVINNAAVFFSMVGLTIYSGAALFVIGLGCSALCGIGFYAAESLKPCVTNLLKDSVVFRGDDSRRGLFDADDTDTELGSATGKVNVPLIADDTKFSSAVTSAVPGYGATTGNSQ